MRHVTDSCSTFQAFGPVLDCHFAALNSLEIRVQKKLRRKQMVEWLKKAVGVTVVSLSLAGQVTELETNMKDPLKLAGALEQDVNFLEDGPYIIDYTQSNSDIEIQDEVPYNSFAMAITLKAELNHHRGTFIGGYDSLIKELSDFQYIATIRKGAAGPIGSLLILLPEEPASFSKLGSILEKHSVFYAFPDGTGTLNTRNVKTGRGILG